MKHCSCTVYLRIYVPVHSQCFVWLTDEWDFEEKKSKNMTCTWDFLLEVNQRDLSSKFHQDETWNDWPASEWTLCERREYVSHLLVNVLLICIKYRNWPDWVSNVRYSRNAPDKGCWWFRCLYMIEGVNEYENIVFNFIVCLKGLKF